MLKKLLGPLFIIVAVVIVALMITFKPEPAIKPVSDNRLKVQVVEKRFESAPLYIQSQGSVTPRWQTNLSSEVSGMVLSVSEQLLAGATFEQGDVLVEVNPNTARANVKQAEANLAQAQLTLLEEQERSKRAREDWTRSGFEGEPTSLVLREPQLAFARAAIASAKAALVKAQDDLARTTIRAPYKGAVVSRSVNPGDFVQPGQTVAAIYSTEQHEVRMPLTQDEFNQLDRQIGANVVLSDPDTGLTWQGEVTRVSQALDDINRWRDVMIEIAPTEKPPLVGQFLDGRIAAKTLARVLIVPEDVLTQDQKVWVAKACGEDCFELDNVEATLLYEDQGRLYLSVAELDATNELLNIVRRPFAGWLKGTAVDVEITEWANTGG